MDFIRSPLNYTGNKFRIISQIVDILPKQINTFVDLFCGGATVGFNIKADNVFLIDQNRHVIELLKFLANSKFTVLVDKIEEQIIKYGLSNSYRFGVNFYSDNIKKDNNGFKHINLNGYNHLKKDYNSLQNKFSDNGSLLLYLLIIYGFNNDIRFNKKGEFNIPIGKTDFNRNNYLKLKKYVNRAKQINYKFICSDYSSKDVQRIIKTSDVIYLDPPYLITNAVYNENGGWTEKNENDLLSFLERCIKLRKNFVLSNIIRKKNKTNFILEKWIEKNKKYLILKKIQLHYKNSSYNKNIRDGSEEEIIIVSKFDEN